MLVDGGAPILESWLAELQDSLQLEKATAYGVRLEGEGFAMEGAHSLGFPQGHGAAMAELAKLLHSTRRRWGYFNPARPEPAQRNRALTMRLSREDCQQLLDQPRVLRARYGLDGEAKEALAASMERSLETFQRMGIAGSHQLRTLVCDGDSLLAWIGGFRSRPFTVGEIRLLTAVTPALLRRLSLERLIGGARVTHLALAAALEEIGRPAFVVNAAGAVAATNALGRAALDRSFTGVRRILAEAVRNGERDARFRVTALGGAGLPSHALLIEQGAPDTAAVTLTAARRWGLTRREQEILVQIAAGRANKAISSELGCSEKTVELHVTNLLRKAEVDSRAALIARLWQRHG